MKKRDFNAAMRPSKPRKGAATCGDGPKWKPCCCPIICATRIAAHPTCQYGRDLINSRNTGARAKVRTEGARRSSDAD